MTEEIIMYGTTWCPDCNRAKYFFNSRGVSFKWIDIGKDPQAALEVERISELPPSKLGGIRRGRNGPPRPCDSSRQQAGGYSRSFSIKTLITVVSDTPF